jgi:general L-amino acid transport system permease protein
VSTRPPPWRDVRVLTWAFQVAVVLVVALVVGWLVGNYRTNVERTNIPTSLDFLDNPASFEIPGNDFSQTQPVRQAYVEGFLNTMRVVIAGLVLATVLGLVVGIGRLSKNFVVRALTAAYVEVFRNVPLLLILVFSFLGIVLQVLPRLNEAWEPLGIAVFSNRGIALPWYDGAGWGLLAILTVAAVAVWAVTRWRHAVFDRRGEPAWAGVWGAMVAIVIVVGGWFALGYGVDLPENAGTRTTGGIRLDPSYFAILFALVVYTASHIAEIVRGSIQAVHRGQDEAAQALALSGFQRMWFVILPQAFRIALPPVGNQYLNLLKNSSLGAVIGYFDLTNVTQITVGNGSPAVPAFVLTLVGYLLASLAISLVVNVLNRRMALVTR